jgi:anaerobic selenocysteine-containing dehydrogenase
MVDSELLDRPLRVLRLDATRKGDADRGPMVTLNPSDARARLLTDGELAWVYGPRRGELATVRLDEALRLGDVVLRDVAGASPSEIVRVVKPDLDNRGRRNTALA